MYDAGYPRPVLCDNLEGGGKGDKDVYLWPIHIYVWQRQSQYCKGIILQLKWKTPQNKLTYRDSPCGLVDKNSPAKKKKNSSADARDMDSIWSGKIQFAAEQLSPVRQRLNLHAAITEACII